MPKESQLKKKAVFFGLDNVLIPGSVDSRVGSREVKKILSGLQALSEKNRDFFWELFPAMQRKKGLKSSKNSAWKNIVPKKTFFLSNPHTLKKKRILTRESI